MRADQSEVSMSAINRRNKKQVYVRTSQQTFEQASSQELIQGKKGMLASAAAAANTAPVTAPTNPAPDSTIEQPEPSVKPMAQNKAKLSLNFQASTEAKEDSEAANETFVPKLRPMLFVQDFPLDNEDNSKKTSLAVEENIWGDYIFKDLTGARLVLEFFTIYAGRYIKLSPSDVALQDSNQYQWCSAEEKKDLTKTKIYRPINEFLRRMLFNNVLEQKQFTNPSLDDRNIWGNWWKEFAHQNPDQDYEGSTLPKMLENLYVQQELQSDSNTKSDALTKVNAFNKFREHIGFLRALTFDIDTNLRFTSLFLFPFGAEALYFDAGDNKDSLSINTRFFRGSGQILFAMLQRTLLAEDKQGRQEAEMVLGQIKDKLDSKFIHIATSSHFAAINQLVRLFSISPKLLKKVDMPPDATAAEIDEKLEAFLQDQLKRPLQEFVLACDKDLAKDTTIKFLPSKNTELELFNNLAKDVAVILDLNTEIEIFDHLCCIMGLYLLRYTALRAQQVFVEAETLITLTDRIANRCEKENISAAKALYEELEQHPLDEIAQNVSKPKYPYFVVESLIKGNDNTSQIRQYSIRLYREHFSIMLKECSERYVDYRVRYALLSMLLKQRSDTAHGAEQTEGNNWSAGLSWQEIIGKENFGLFLKNGLDYYLLKEFNNKSLAKHDPDRFWKQLMQELNSSNNQGLGLDDFIGALQNKVTTRKGDDYRCFTTLGKSIGLISSEGSRGLRFILSDKMLKALVVTTLKDNKYLRDQDFFQQLFDRFGLIIDTKQFEAMQRQCAAKGSAQSTALGDNVDFKPNTANFIQRLVSLNLCEKLPDSSITYIKNPYVS